MEAPGRLGAAGRGPEGPKIAARNDGYHAARKAANPDARRRLLIDRLYRAFGRQIRQMEVRLKDKETDEKDAPTLGNLARTLDTLMALERDNGTTAERPEPADRDAINAELARRITRWAEGGEGPE